MHKLELKKNRISNRNRLQFQGRGNETQPTQANERERERDRARWKKIRDFKFLHTPLSAYLKNQTIPNVCESERDEKSETDRASENSELKA